MNAKEVFVVMVTAALAIGVSGIWLGKLSGIPSIAAGNGVRYEGRVVPAEGLKLNPNGLNGLQNDAESDFRQIYSGMRAYIDANGQFPISLKDLVTFTEKMPEWQRVTMEDLSSPDAAKSDHPTHTAYTKCYMWGFRAPRPDGSPKPAKPKAGERDVWLVSQNAYRSNHVVYPDGRQTYSPEGYFLVLWSDGEVERVKPEDRVALPNGAGSSELHFRGATGVPANAKRAGNLVGPWR